MTKARLFAYAVVLASFSTAAEARPLLVPAPREVEWSGSPLRLVEGSVAIVVGESATLPEQTAADLLQRSVAKRFAQKWSVSKEGEKAAQPVVVLIGQRTTNKWLDRLCREKQIDLSAGSPGHDGYVIVPVKDGEQQIMLVGASNPRAAIYGADTLFQLLARNGEDLVLEPATIRDAPSIPWRGRPQTNVTLYLNPGEMDLYMRSRINFIDLRNGIYAYEPGDPYDEAEIKRVLSEAHRCGIVVYATINCGVPKNKHETILKMYEAFLALGADGLWLSFDDKGAGEAPEELVRSVLELGKRHNISGHLIATTPPKGAYQNIPHDFNRRIMAIPGMETTTWFWTALPLPQAMEEARAIGMKSRPSWWHNWTRPDPGFTHPEAGTYVNGARSAYMEVPPLSEGWHAPSYEMLRDAAGSADAIMPWGGNGWGQYYVVPVIGWWGWSPERHDFNSVRGRIYDLVFGTGQVEAARRFDDGLKRVKRLFEFVENASEFEPMCPGRLRDPKRRGEAESLLAEMRKQFAAIEKGASAESMLEPEIVKTLYLDAMRVEMETGEIELRLAYPEFWWQGHQREVLNAVYDGDLKKADELIAKARPRVLAEVEEVAKKLHYLRPVAAYVKWWRDRAGMTAIDWQKLTADRRQIVAARVKDYNGRAAPTAGMLKDLANPPLGWGTGRWEVSNRVLATVVPSEREMFWGEWVAGLHTYGHTKAAVFALNPKVLGTEGGFAELDVTVPLSGDRKRLALLLFISDSNKENIGSDDLRNRMAGYRSVKLLWGDRTLWQADVGIQRESGEWFMARLPEIPSDVKELPLRLRVEDVIDTQKNFCVVFVGPIRLMELGQLQLE